MRAILILSLFMFVSQAIAQQNKKVLVWSEEFDYSGLPSSDKWTYDVGGNGFGNNEVQYYTKDRLENARVENGHLILEARKENYSGMKFTSARIKTIGNGDWKYGRFEIRAKLPKGRGIWPAIWFLPSESVYGNWPSSGEIDLMEYVGYDPLKIFFTTHTETYNHASQLGGRGSSTNLTAPYDNFYSYALEWYQDSLLFMVDDVVYYRQYKAKTDTYKEWPFDQKMFLILNNAIGGDWAGSQGIDSTIFPQKFEVDYVRVYQFSETKSEYDLLVQDATGGTVSSTHANGKVPVNGTVKLEAIPAPNFEFVKWDGTYQVNDNPLEFSMAIDVTVRPIFRKVGDMIKNGDFSSAFANWSKNVPSNLGSSSIENGEAVFNITKSAANPWDIQFSQDGLMIEKGSNYTLTFDVWADQATTINTGVGMSHDPWTLYSGNTFSVGTTKKTITYSFTMTYASDANGRVIFDIGKALGELHIDNITLVNNTVLGQKAAITNASVTMYPNPSNGRFLVESQSIIKNIAIYSSDGKVVYQQEKIQKDAAEIFVTKLPKGIYVVEVETVEGIQKKRLIKE